MAYEKEQNRGGGKTLRKTTSGIQKLRGVTRGVSLSSKKFYELEAAEVTKVIVNETSPGYKSGADVGKIKCRMSTSQYNLPVSQLGWIKPMNPNISNIPVVGEYVIVAEYFGEKYYMATLNKMNNVNNNIYPGLSINPLKKSLGANPNGYKSAEASGGNQGGGVTKAMDMIYKNYHPSAGVLPVKVYEGDFAINGKFGQSIRMGYGKSKTEAYNSPNILLRCGQRMSSDDPTGFLGGMGFNKPMAENINDDGSSIYLTTNEISGIITATDKDTTNKVSNKSWKVPVKGKKVSVPTMWDGKQIILNSDRLIFNSRKNEQIFSALGVQYFCTSSWFISDSKLGTVLNTTGQTVIRNKKGTIINSKKIFLGVPDESKPKLKKGKCEHLVMGETLKKILGEIIDAVMKAQYVNGAGPASLNPANLPKFMGIKNKLGKILSKQNFTM